MDRLIEALTIMRKYGTASHPVDITDGDVIRIQLDGKKEPTSEDLIRLQRLEWMWDHKDRCFYSFYYARW